jgi:hypothetical protein
LTVGFNALSEGPKYDIAGGVRAAELHKAPPDEEHVIWGSTVATDLQKRWSAQR